MDPQPSVRINYPALGATIAIGVAVGMLAANWITAEVISAQARREVAATAQAVERQAAHARQATAEASQRTQAGLAAQQEQLRNQRRQDREGTRLAQACSDWRQAEATTKSSTASAEATRHCAKLEAYVQTGVARPN